MPIYEYKCQSCGTQEENLEKISAPEVYTCPSCGTTLGMRRQLSVAAVATSGGHGSGSAVAPFCAGGTCPLTRG